MTSSTPRPPRNPALGSRRTLAGIAVIVLSGCTGVGPPPAPEPIRSERSGSTSSRPESSRPEPPATADRSARPPSTAARRAAGVAEETTDEVLFEDEILISSWEEHPEIRDRVEFWIEFWTGRGEGEFRRSLERMSSYEPFVLAALEERGLPPSLRFLPIPESSYSPHAVSPVRAVGLWQFMAPTAEWLGMDVGTLVDERRDPIVSTETALDYLLQINEDFESWYLTLAAYNAGPGRIGRIVEQYAPNEPRTDDLFVRLRPRMPAETRDFIPRFIAVAEIASNAEAYGFGDVTPRPEMAFDEVVIPDATSLDVIARAAEVSKEEIDFLNPHYLEDVTPPGREVTIRIPPGRSARFEANYAQIPEEERVTLIRHRIRSGETLTHIARDYGVSVAMLRDANPRLDPRRLQIGQVVIVTRVPEAASDRSASAASSSDHVGEDRAAEGGAVHVVRRGESLWSVARSHGMTLDELLRLNGIDRNRTLQPGDELRVVTGGITPGG